MKSEETTNITHAQLEQLGWHRAHHSCYSKNGFTMWLWDYWTLEEAPRNIGEKAQVIKRDVKTVSELNLAIEVHKALGGRSIQSEGPSAASAEETGPEGGTPNSLVINVEALEKEGWEKRTKEWVVKGQIEVFFHGPQPDVYVGNVAADGVKTMPDLRELCRLVG